MSAAAAAAAAAVELSWVAVAPMMVASSRLLPFSTRESPNSVSLDHQRALLWA